MTSVRSLEQDLVTLADITGSDVTAALEFADARSAAETLASLRAQEHVLNAAVYDKEGKVLAARGGRGSGFTPAKPRENFAGRLGFRGAEVFRAVNLNGERIGVVYLESDFGEVQNRLINFTAIYRRGDSALTDYGLPTGLAAAAIGVGTDPGTGQSGLLDFAWEGPFGSRHETFQ